MPRSVKCPSCCPDGGAIFRMDLGRGSDSHVYAMTCQNCGYQRKQRGPTKKSLLHTYDYVTREAPSDDGMSAANAIRFHCFNPNGVYSRLKEMHKRLDVWLAEHPEMPNGCLMVHGSLHDYPRKRLFEALDAPKKRKKVSYTVWSAVRYAEECIERGDDFINDPDRWPTNRKDT